jgi:hypothetical protein
LVWQLQPEVLAQIPAEILDQIVRDGPLTAEEIETASRRFPTVVAAWRRAWARVTPFFAFPPEIRPVIYTTNALESLHAQLRKEDHQDPGAFSA